MKIDGEIYFRASSFGALMTKEQGTGFTENMAKELTSLLYELEHGVNENGNKVSWTLKKKERLAELSERKKAPPTLSKSAKSQVNKMWLSDKKGFYKELENKYVLKGLMNEEDGIELVSAAHNTFYGKNEERIYKDNITGECDIIYTDENNRRIVIDIKCSWDVETYMNADLSNIYEYQLRCYMYLYDADEAYLSYCLTDAPINLVESEKRKYWYKYNDPNASPEEQELIEAKLELLYEQVERNMIYSNNPAYTEEEKVKTYKIIRDFEIEKQMLEKVKPALEYYKSITLNQI